MYRYVQTLKDTFLSLGLILITLLIYFTMFCIVSCVFVVLPGYSRYAEAGFFSKEPSLCAAVEKVMDTLTAEQDIP